jgi:hypothetical protein
MTERSDQPQNPSEDKQQPEIYSIHQHKDGSFHLSRRNFLFFSAAVGGSLVLRGVCPRFGAKSSSGEPVQAGMNVLPRVYVHTRPNIASNIADTLEPNDFVRLISDRPDLDWVEVATQSGQQGWVKRSFVDFSRLVKSKSPDFDLSNTPTPSSPPTHPTQNFSVQLRGGDSNLKEVASPGQALACGESIQNGDFEAGSVSWVEETTGYIITNTWTDPYQGSWVAWLGGLNAVERLTQLIHVPANVQDVQRLYFWLKVTSEDPAIAPHDTLTLRFLDGAGNHLLDIPLFDNTDRMDWTQWYIELKGMSGLAGQDLQIQFEAVLDANYITSFVIDLVSLNLLCDPIPPTATATQEPPENYNYLPVVAKPTVPTPTATPSPTPTPTATPCPAYNPCPTHCSSDCSSDCSYDCTYDCSSDCTFDCIYDCTFDCIYDCAYDW